eukprot:Lankesteria_metandrocarpae@DN1184_c0_g1_i1.p1
MSELPADGVSDDEDLGEQEDQFDDEQGDDELAQQALEKGASIPEDIARFSSALLWWLTMQNGTEVDIIETFGNTFLLHAESLILYYATHRDLTAHHNQPSASFGSDPQFVKLVYHLEVFLQRLRRCGGQFTLVFFDAYRTVLSKVSPALWALRNCFYVHAKCHESQYNGTVRRFPSWWSAEYERFLKSNTPAFILLEDSSSTWQKLPTSYILSNNTTGTDNN